MKQFVMQVFWKAFWLGGVTGLAIGALVEASQAAPPSPPEFAGPIATYKIYVQRQITTLIQKTSILTDAIRAGDLVRAQKLYGASHTSYDRIRPISVLFNDIDRNLVSGADDYEKKEQDPGFIGFHRIEYGLFVQKSTDGLGPVSDQLMWDVIDLQRRIKELTLPPGKVLAGAATLIAEVAAKDISGQDDRYAHTDLWDIAANIDGARTVIEILHPMLQVTGSALLGQIDANFAAVDRIFAKYRTGDGGFVSFEKVTEADRQAMQRSAATLAENLSKLSGMLGLN